MARPRDTWVRSPLSAVSPARFPDDAVLPRPPGPLPQTPVPMLHHVRLHAAARLAARPRAGVVVGVAARRAVGDRYVRTDTLPRLAAGGLAAAGDGRDGVA